MTISRDRAAEILLQSPMNKNIREILLDRFHKRDFDKTLKYLAFGFMNDDKLVLSDLLQKHSQTSIDNFSGSDLEEVLSSRLSTFRLYCALQVFLFLDEFSDKIQMSDLTFQKIYFLSRFQNSKEVDFLFNKRFLDYIFQNNFLHEDHGLLEEVKLDRYLGASPRYFDSLYTTREPSDIAYKSIFKQHSTALKIPYNSKLAPWVLRFLIEEIGNPEESEQALMLFIENKNSLRGLFKYALSYRKDKTPPEIAAMVYI